MVAQQRGVDNKRANVITNDINMNSTDELYSGHVQLAVYHSRSSSFSGAGWKTKFLPMAQTLGSIPVWLYCNGKRKTFAKLWQSRETNVAITAASLVYFYIWCCRQPNDCRSLIASAATAAAVLSFTFERTMFIRNKLAEELTIGYPTPTAIDRHTNGCFNQRSNRINQQLSTDARLPCPLFMHKSIRFAPYA